MRRFFCVLAHADSPKRVVDAHADFLGRHAVVFKAESHILLHNRRDDLVIRILKDHARVLTDIENEVVVLRVHPADPNRAASRHIQRVEELGQRRFAAAVVAENRQKLALLHAHAHLIDRVLLRFRVTVAEAAGDDTVFLNICHRFILHTGTFCFASYDSLSQLR